MNESFESKEPMGITDQQAIEALKLKDTDPAQQAVFEQWLDQLQTKIDKVYELEGSKNAAAASIGWSVRRAVVYYSAGYHDEAIADLTETCDAAGSKLFEGSELYDAAVRVLARMKAGEL